MDPDPPRASSLSPEREARFREGATFTSRFFLGTSEVQLAQVVDPYSEG